MRKKPADRDVANEVAQICNLLYRRIAFGGAWRRVRACELAAASGLKIRDTAECNSALRPSCNADGNLLEKETRLIVKAMVGLMNITCKYAGII